MAINTIGRMELDELIASGRNPLHTRVITIKGATALTRGQLIGASGSGEAISYGAFVEGNTPVGILCKDITPTTAGVDAQVYVSGHFNGNKVIGYTKSLDADLRDIGIFVDNAITY